ncbi:helix-turn-helix domain-containing protein [Streptomyces alkaliphilus]|uniref:Helix-turn-helix domain-containing protein n=1 Tax=Streptomyces alkaliphilus TaxID=1472722 RepID=A0A7W3Y166_9ACTN|nr:helix-turn-helix transcriptional regulator [Streptomyces alkaliphilus]MBB0244213.1 helix-turn-helix domain-containing protein [Streptomyces alkaliphilus]
MRSQGLKELGSFLSARRAEITPESVGLPQWGRRRTPGLRREEVAQLAGVGVSWYTWIEQGRALNVSLEIIEAIAKVLRLDDAQRMYVRRLAGHKAELDGPAFPLEASTFQPFVDNWLPNPAYILDHHYKAVAVNSTAYELLGLHGGSGNLLWDFFTHEPTRGRFPRHEEDAADLVARVRTHCARYPNDSGLNDLIQRLRGASEQFEELWNRHEVREDACGIDLFTHPLVGELALKRTCLSFPDRVSLRLVLFLPVPGMDSLPRLEILSRTRASVQGTPETSPTVVPSPAPTPRPLDLAILAN